MKKTNNVFVFDDCIDFSLIGGPYHDSVEISDKSVKIWYGNDSIAIPLRVFRKINHLVKNKDKIRKCSQEMEEKCKKCLYRFNERCLLESCSFVPNIE